ncbi:MAG TPA: SDR family oxidoreductase [Myxococcota bacterium]|nr:SDR family oxidoreductase [Myxococcota bacterium]HQK50769.1 SDR family oxidoreductase [Myxococcota bacterium]
MSRILVFGCTSAIAIEAARTWASRKERLFLVARDPQKLQVLAGDLRARGATQVETLVMDALDFDRHPSLLETAEQALGGPIDRVLVAHGVLSDEARGRADYGAAERDLKVNFLSVVSILTPIANTFEARKQGVIAVIGSVAGDRGRQSNYLYGTSKAAVATFLQGLRNRLWKSGVAVVTIKPGFVDTPMTAHLQKSPLFASPQKVGRGIVRAMDRRRDVVYLPAFWRPILLAVIHIPEALFKKMSL